MKRYCAFGNWYQDSKGEVLEESENFYVVKAEGWVYNLALGKKGTIKVFDTEEERDKWIEDQNYQYDPR